MKAWHKDGATGEHPEPWGLPGVFTTVRVGTGKKISFFDSHLHRLIDSANRAELPWVPSPEDITTKVEEFMADIDPNHGLLRICLFENLIGMSSRPAESDGNPVEGWLLHYRRPNPVIKSTKEKELYGSLGELEITKEDWVIIDPKDNDIRETATSNLIFAKEEELLIPDKWVLKGIVLQQLLPFLRDRFTVTSGFPQDQDISSFDEILLCGTGRGVAPLTALSELGWSSQENEIFSTIRAHYEEIIESSYA